MKPKTRQEAIDQVKRIAENGCIGIHCYDCIFLPQPDGCFFEQKIVAKAFLMGAEFNEENTVEKLKSCPQCGDEIPF